MNIMFLFIWFDHFTRNFNNNWSSMRPRESWSLFMIPREHLHEPSNEPRHIGIPTCIIYGWDVLHPPKRMYVYMYISIISIYQVIHLKLDIHYLKNCTYDRFWKYFFFIYNFKPLINNICLLYILHIKNIFCQSKEQKVISNDEEI